MLEIQRSRYIQIDDGTKSTKKGYDGSTKETKTRLSESGFAEKLISVNQIESNISVQYL